MCQRVSPLQENEKLKNWKIFFFKGLLREGGGGGGGGGIVGVANLQPLFLGSQGKHFVS